MPSARPHAIGIDLGTTFSVLAHLDASGRPVSVPNAEGDITTPSVVLFEDNGVVVGKEALKAAAIEPDRVAQHAKRDMGNTAYHRPINGEQIPPEVVQAFVLEKLRKDSEAHLGEVRQAVITVPAYFTEPKRKATQDAGQLAGLEVLDIINEPTAAALAFGVREGFLSDRGESSRRELILVYDLGGGTFDVTLLEISGRRYTALATAGDACLGGIDWDQRLVDEVASEFQARHRGLDPRQDPIALQRLLREVEETKRALSAREQITFNFEHQALGLRLPLTRAHFEELTADLVERTRFTVVQLLKEARVDWGSITRVLLTGGSTRMPMISRMLEAESGRPPDRTLSADEAVAHGAALYAGLLLANPAVADMQVDNVNAHDLSVLGVELRTGRNRRKVMIARNSPLPASRTSRFQTRNPDQRTIAVPVIEGGDDTGSDATPIGSCVVRDLPDGLPAGTPVDVTFSYEPNGRLTVSARVPTQGREAAIRIERATGLSEEGIAGWDQRLRGGFRPLQMESS